MPSSEEVATSWREYIKNKSANKEIKQIPFENVFAKLVLHGQE